MTPARHHPSVATVALEAGLSSCEAEALFLHCEGLSHDAIAERLGISVNAVKIRLSRGGRRVRAHLCGLAAVAEEQDAEERRWRKRVETALSRLGWCAGPFARR